MEERVEVLERIVTDQGYELRQKFRDLRTALSDLKFLAFLIILGVMFWIPFWAFFNLCALYVDQNVDTAKLYHIVRGILGPWVADFLSHVDEDGTPLAIDAPGFSHF